MLHELQLWVGDFFCTSLYCVAYNGLFYIQYQIISLLIIQLSLVIMIFEK